MGMSLGSKSRRRGRTEYRQMSDINVTPFVDVMLVLLIVFMVTAPLLTVGVEVDLPKTEANQLDVKKDPIIVSVTKEGKVFLKETVCSKARASNFEWFSRLVNLSKPVVWKKIPEKKRES